MRLWVVTPCYFDVPSFEKVRSGVLVALRDQGLSDLQVYFVLIDDSARQDGMVKKVRDHKDVFVITPPYNLGHQAALVFALRTLRSKINPQDLVVTMDSDGEDVPSDVPQLVLPLLAKMSELHQVTIAKRTQRKETFLFKLFYSCFKLLFLTLTGTIIRNGNFVAFRGWFLEELIFHPHFDQCYASGFVSLPLTIEFVPLARGLRFEGKSKMGYFGLVTHGIRMLMPFSEKIAVRGLIFCSVGMFLGFLLGLYSLSLTFLFFIGVFALLFATFSQTKARSLRELVELKDRSARERVTENDIS